jgi:ATP-dependent helicase/nuclease subunit A
MAESGEMPDATWRQLRGRLSEIAISTIDAFCLSLLGEFPLEADVDPGFGVADETETPRLVDEALDRTPRRSPPRTAPVRSRTARALAGARRRSATPR